MRQNAYLADAKEIVIRILPMRAKRLIACRILPRLDKDRKKRAPSGRIENERVGFLVEAVADVRGVAIVLVPGFDAVGIADNLLEALHDQSAREWTIVANNSGNDRHRRTTRR